MPFKKVIFFGLIFFFAVYTLFWVKIFNRGSTASRSTQGPVSSLPATPVKQANSDFVLRSASARSAIAFGNNSLRVVGSPSSAATLNNSNIISQSYKIDLLPRKQAFNLSCEFAAATAIIYHYTNDLFFAPKNQKEAEKILIEKVGASQNPNIGIRMGESALESLEFLYQNLNSMFGGSEYYGVHAPPFIDVFKNYGLTAVPLNKNGDIINDIKKAIFKGHLVMSWLNVGEGKKIDLVLSVGDVPVVRGEHVVVVNGYDENGFFIMDPGSGRERFVKFNEFFDATRLFVFPYLEVYPSTSYFPFDLTVPVDIKTGFNRSLIKVKIQNAGKAVGVVDEMRGILKEFGYKITGVENLKCEECFNIKVKLKKELKDYVDIVKKDLEFAFYKIDNISLDLKSSDSADMVVIIGN